ncbi:MAG: sigma factor-like helix-turn-helix DNA-binding protein [Ilumatobacteraceae bacterium]
MTEIRHDLHDATADAFAEFYARTEPQLRRALVAALGPSAGSEAAAQAMAYGYEHWQRVGALDNPAGYLYRVGRNAARNRRRPLPLVLPDQAAEPGFEPGLPVALNRLSEQQRQAVLLVNAWGTTLSEAAAILGVSVSTLRNHLNRGMDRLRRELGAHDV